MVLQGENKSYLSIVAPAYNEELVIREVVEGWATFIKKEKLDAEIVICNDGSTDKTGEILKKLQKKYPNLVVCENRPNQGYGAGVENAVRHTKGELIMTLDSDGQFDVKGFKKLHKKLFSGNYDLITGFRFRKRDSFARVVADRIFNIIMRLVFGLPFEDTNCAQKLYRAKLLKRINIEARGYPAPTEMLTKAAEMGAKIGEVGVAHYERKKGATALKLFKTSANVFKFLVYLRLKLYLYQKKIIGSF